MGILVCCSRFLFWGLIPLELCDHLVSFHGPAVLVLVLVQLVFIAGLETKGLIIE